MAVKFVDFLDIPAPSQRTVEVENAIGVGFAQTSLYGEVVKVVKLLAFGVQTKTSCAGL